MPSAMLNDAPPMWNSTRTRIGPIMLALRVDRIPSHSIVTRAESDKDVHVGCVAAREVEHAATIGRASHETRVGIGGFAVLSKLIVLDADLPAFGRVCRLYREPAILGKVEDLRRHLDWTDGTSEGTCRPVERVPHAAGRPSRWVCFIAQQDTHAEGLSLARVTTFDGDRRCTGRPTTSKMLWCVSQSTRG